MTWTAIRDPRATIEAHDGLCRVRDGETITDYQWPFLLKVGRKVIRLMPTPSASEPGPARWRYQLRRSLEQRARVETKLRLYAGSLAEKAYRAKLRQIDDDIVNYQAALFAAGEPVDPTPVN